MCDLLSKTMKTVINRINLEMIQVLMLTEKDFKIATINMFYA